MNISLEEQIEYMRGEARYWDNLRTDFRFWNNQKADNAMLHCKAILDTLEEVRDERRFKVPDETIETTKPE
jgi:hypothetical protein